jgi:hypothetical protein
MLGVLLPLHNAFVHLLQLCFFVTIVFIVQTFLDPHGHALIFLLPTIISNLQCDFNLHIHAYIAFVHLSSSPCYDTPNNGYCLDYTFKCSIKRV